jgi:hypothetical protein
MSSASESQRAAGLEGTGPEQARAEPAQPARAGPELSPESVRSSHPLRNRRFLMWWIGASISLLGDQFYVVALPWVVLQITGRDSARGADAPGRSRH